MNIHGKLNGYVIPGPAVIAGGVTKTPGAGGCTGCAATCEVGKGPVGTAVPVPGGGTIEHILEEVWADGDSESKKLKPILSHSC